MNNPAFPDPGNLWRDLLRQREDAGNSMGADAMSAEFSKFMNQMSSSSAACSAPSPISAPNISPRCDHTVREHRFHGGALMRDHVKDADGRKHDIVVLSHDVARNMSLKEMYGLADVF